MRAAAGLCVPATACGEPESGAPRGDDRGLITLEWLLIVGAVAGMAAAAVLVVQQVVDTAADAPDDPLVRVLEADIAAALIAAEANEAVLDPAYERTKEGREFQRRCVTGLRAEFGDIITGAAWSRPVPVSPQSPQDPQDPPAPPTLRDPARCTVTPRQGLGG